MSRRGGSGGRPECPTPTKTPYATESVALSSAARRSFERQPRAYTCQCGWAHLTSRPGRPAPVDDPGVTARVVAMSEPEFYELVGADVRGTVTAQEAGALRAPVNLDRWAAALKAMEADLQLQFAHRAADKSATAQGWRSRTTALQACLHERRTEARAARVARQERAAAERARLAAIGAMPVKEAQAAVRDRARARLVRAHHAEFVLLLAEEFERAGLELPTRVVRQLARNSVGAQR